MRNAVLVLLTRSKGEVEELLLAYKRTGEIGIGHASAPGGKVDARESLRHACTRETWEEFRITIPNNKDMLREVAVLDSFEAVGQEKFKHFMRVFIYAGRAFGGEPLETDDMHKPFWSAFHQIPYQDMYPGDEQWMPQVLRGETDQTHFQVYRRDGVLVRFTQKALLPFDKLMET